MNGQRPELAHGILILIGLGLFVAGIMTRTYGASGIGIVVVGANLHGLTEHEV
jgi:membrane-bound ClpP family serine protease